MVRKQVFSLNTALVGVTFLLIPIQTLASRRRQIRHPDGWAPAEQPSPSSSAKQKKAGRGHTRVDQDAASEVTDRPGIWSELRGKSREWYLEELKKLSEINIKLGKERQKAVESLGKLDGELAEVGTKRAGINLQLAARRFQKIKTREAMRSKNKRSGRKLKGHSSKNR